MTVSNDIRWIGVNDHDIDLFEGQYRVPSGMSYNSYIILDEKIAVMDTVDRRFTDVWLSNLEKELSGRTPDYLIVHHMEPDHAGSIGVFTEKYPETIIVASRMAFNMMKQFFGNDFSDRRMIVQGGDSLSLGSHEEIFLAASMVHWPEVIMNYDTKDKVLFSADGFGKFGAADAKEEWDDEARRYYIGIVGKYGPQVQAVLKAAKDLDIAAICPLHGPVLKEDLDHYLDLYDKWSSYEPETDGVLIAYTSVYKHTEAAVKLLAEELSSNGTVWKMFDLARADMAEAVGEAFRFSKLVLATTTYNTDIFPPMRTFIEHLSERGFQKRTAALIENGSWAPQGIKVMKNMLEPLKDISLCENNITIRSAMTEENAAQIKALAEELK